MEDDTSSLVSRRSGGKKLPQLAAAFAGRLTTNWHKKPIKYPSVKYRISPLYVISLIKLLNHSKSLGKSHLSASGCHAGCDATSREITLTQCDRTYVFISKSRLVRARRRHHLDIPGPPPHIRFVCTYFDTTM